MRLRERGRGGRAASVDCGHGNRRHPLYVTIFRIWASENAHLHKRLCPSHLPTNAIRPCKTADIAAPNGPYGVAKWPESRAQTAPVAPPRLHCNHLFSHMQPWQAADAGMPQPWVCINTDGVPSDGNSKPPPACSTRHSALRAARRRNRPRSGSTSRAARRRPRA